MLRLRQAALSALIAALLLVPVPARGAFFALTTNLISFWELEEASGTRNDAHSTNHLTDNASVGSAVGKVGTAADLESGSFQYLSRADNAALSTGDIDFSVAAWIKIESLGSYMAIAAKGDHSSNQREYEFFIDGGTNRAVFRVSSNGTVAGLSSNLEATTFGALSTATWYFVVAYHDSVNNLIGVCVNNTCDTASWSSGAFDGTAAFMIGRDLSDGSAYFDGLIDQAGFWKKVLTSQDKIDLYNGGSGISYATLSGGGPTFVPRQLLLGCCEAR